MLAKSGEEDKPMVRTVSRAELHPDWWPKLPGWCAACCLSCLRWLLSIFHPSGNLTTFIEGTLQSALNAIKDQTPRAFWDTGCCALLGG